MMITRSRVTKWGNSLGVRIPKGFIQELHLGDGSSVEISIVDGSLTIKPVVESRFTLTELLAKVTPENLHGEIDSGKARGKEAF